MLHWVAVDNFRSCSGVRLNLDGPVIALVGKNGVGKTNVLHAIELVCRLCVGAAEWGELQPVDPGRSARIEVEFSVEANRFRYRADRMANGRDISEVSETLWRVAPDGKSPLVGRANDRIELPGRPPIAVGKEAAAAPALVQLLPAADPVSQSVQPVLAFLSGARYYRLTDRIADHEPSNPFVAEGQFEEWASLGPVSRARSDSVKMRLIDMHENRAEDFEELMAILGARGLGLVSSVKIRRARVPDGSAGAYTIGFVPGSDLAGAGRVFTYEALSGGTRRVIQLLTHVMYDRSAVMLLEQPEDCIHAGLVRKLIDVLQTYADRTQLVLSTHSARVVNLLAPASLRVVTARNGQTSVHGFDEAEVHRITGYLSEDGTLSEYLETL